MRYIILILIFSLTACGSDNIGDCFEIAGDIVELEYEVSDFTKFRSETGTVVHIKQGLETKIVVRCGENLVDDAVVEVQGDVLVVRNEARCNLFREYGKFEVFLTVPNLIEIRNASEFDIFSEGVLSFPNLVLVSDTSYDSKGAPGRKSGEFYLDLECTNLTVQANGKSVFYLSGTTTNLRANFPNEGPRLEGRDLIAQNVIISQTSANKMIVNPQQSLKGTIFGIGDVIAVNRPPIVEVEERYTGRLIFED